MKKSFICSKCHKVKYPEHDFTPGYGVNIKGEKICFLCIAIEDKATMIEKGDSKSLPLYLVKNNGKSEVTNWPGTLRFNVISQWVSGHNWGLKRYNVRFIGPDLKIWYGYNIGENTQIIHCKRTNLTDCYA